jgi:hypothetical protein
MHLRAVLLLLVPALSWADACDQLPKPAVAVHRLEEPITVNKQYGYRELTPLGSSLARPGQQVLELTRGRASARFSLSVASRIERSGRWECASPQLTVSYGFSPLTVYVAREFPEGSCAFKEIYRHEMRHVQTYLAHLVSIESELSATLNRRFASDAPWRGAAGQVRTALERELNERWLPYIQRAIDRVDADQSLIDSPEEYARLADACEGEIRQLMR